MQRRRSALQKEKVMIVFNEIMQRIRELLVEREEKEIIYDKDIAGALALTPEYFAVIKKRGKIPYEAIAAFCHRHHISLNWILLGQGIPALCPKESEKRTA